VPLLNVEGASIIVDLVPMSLAVVAVVVVGRLYIGMVVVVATATKAMMPAGIRDDDGGHWRLLVHVHRLLVQGRRLLVAAVLRLHDRLAVGNVWLRGARRLRPATVAAQPVVVVATMLPPFKAGARAEHDDDEANQASSSILCVAHQHVVLAITHE
jgi:hypothetical protein